MISLLLFSTLSLAAEPAIPDARVVMPWTDFKKLYEAGKAPEEKPEVAPQSYSLNRATYEGRVSADGESATFTAKMQVQVHKDKGWIVVPLLPTSVALKSAKLGGADAPIFLQNGWYTLITDKKGVLAVELTFATQVFEADGTSSMSFPMAPSAGTEVFLDVPNAKDDLEFKVGQAKMVKDELRGDVRRMEALLPATSGLSISYTREITPGAAAEEALAEARRYAEVHTLVGVSEGVLTGHSDIMYTIVHQGLTELTVTLPADVAVLDVTGSGVREWTATRKGDLQQVEVDLNFEALGSYKLMLDYERVLAEGSVDTQVPVVGVEGVERVKGFVGVAALSTLEVLSEGATGARRVDVRELPASVLGRTDQPVLLGFKYRQADYKVPLRVNQHQDVDVLVTIADTAEAVTMVTPDGKVMSQMVWYVRNNRRQFLRISLPEGAELWSVKVADKAVQPAKDDKGDILIPLVRSRASGSALAAFSVELVWIEAGQAPDEKGNGAVDLALPVADIPQTYVRWAVYLPYEAKVKAKATESSMRQVEYFSTPVTPEGEYLGAAGQAEMQQAYVAQNNAVEGGVAPVDVAMPIGGMAYYFEELLVVDEAQTVHMEYKGLK
ncbi:hypothetical protein L6R49_14490 [Myxococcota bacterium]|nr:hypothetical protein [Myxococcota bacterium]